jgi:hypothetical protein
MRNKGHLAISRDRKDDHRWAAIAANGNSVAHGGEGYRNHADMRQGLVTATAIQLAALTPSERLEVLRYVEWCEGLGDEVTHEHGEHDV